MKIDKARAIGVFVVAAVIAAILLAAGVGTLRVGGTSPFQGHRARDIAVVASNASAASSPGGARAVEPTGARVSQRPSVASAPAAGVDIAPMTEADAQTLNHFREEMALAHDDEAAYFGVLKNEPPDPIWSPDTEQLIGDELRRHGGNLMAMRTLPPKCVRSLCSIAMRGGVDAEGDGANMQRVMADLGRQPWFKEKFKDSVMSMGMRDGELVYSVYLLRRD